MERSRIKLNGEVTLEFTADGFTVISELGTRSIFDKRGYFIKEEGEFLWIKHFFLMGKEERECVAAWFLEVQGQTKKQESFLKIVEMALKDIDYDYRISTIEPSWDSSVMICFETGCEVKREISYKFWWRLCKAFAPEWKSGMATLEELFLWYAYRIAMGWWSIEYVCDNSSSAGNYSDAPNATHCFAKSGTMKVGGFADGIGNSEKIVLTKADSMEFAMCSGFYGVDGSNWCVSDVQYIKENDICFTGTGVIALRGVPN